MSAAENEVDSVSDSDAERFLLSSPTWRTRVFGDERASVPVGGLRLRHPALDHLDDEPFAEFLRIEPDEFRSRRERREREEFSYFERAVRSYPVPKPRPANATAAHDRLQQLVDALAVAAGFRVQNPHRWRRTKHKLAFSLEFRPPRRPAPGASTLLVGVSLMIRDPSTNARLGFAAADCHDSAVPGTLVVRDGVAVFECSYWRVTGSLAERAFGQSVTNLLDLFAWIAAERGRWAYLQDEQRKWNDFVAERRHISQERWQRNATARLARWNLARAEMVADRPRDHPKRVIRGAYEDGWHEQPHLAHLEHLLGMLEAGYQSEHDVVRQAAVAAVRTTDDRGELPQRVLWLVRHDLGELDLDPFAQRGRPQSGPPRPIDIIQSLHDEAQDALSWPHR